MNRLACMLAFVETVEAGSFTAASPALGLTAPMVGRQVRALEDHLRVSLLTRTTRRHSLTEAGRRYFERCKTLLAELDAAEDNVASLREGPRGLLRVDAPVTFGSTCLAPVLADYLAANPEMRVDLTLNNRVVDLVEEGYDAVIRTGVLPDSRLMSRALSPFPLMACAAPTYLERHGEPQTLDDLEHHACLRFRPGAPHDVWTFVGEGGSLATVKVSGPFSSNSGHALRAAAVAGMGITLQAAALLEDDVRSGALRTVLAGMTPKPLPMHVLFPVGRPVLPKLRSFLDFMTERF